MPLTKETARRPSTVVLEEVAKEPRGSFGTVGLAATVLKAISDEVKRTGFAHESPAGRTGPWSVQEGARRS